MRFSVCFRIMVIIRIKRTVNMRFELDSGVGWGKYQGLDEDQNLGSVRQRSG